MITKCIRKPGKVENFIKSSDKIYDKSKQVGNIYQTSLVNINLRTIQRYYNCKNWICINSKKPSNFIMNYWEII